METLKNFDCEKTDKFCPIPAVTGLWNFSQNSGRPLVLYFNFYHDKVIVLVVLVPLVFWDEDP